MTPIEYGWKIRTGLGVDATESWLREALKEEGFGVLTEIDVGDTLRDKLGVEMAPYRILGVCSPPLAAQALDAEPDIGLLLPCTVAIYEKENETVVSVLDPATMVTLTENEALQPIAQEAQARLERVVAGIEIARKEAADA